mgnify:CR=1 FL=1
MKKALVIGGISLFVLLPIFGAGASAELVLYADTQFLGVVLNADSTSYTLFIPGVCKVTELYLDTGQMQFTHTDVGTMNYEEIFYTTSDCTGTRYIRYQNEWAWTDYDTGVWKAWSDALVYKSQLYYADASSGGKCMSVGSGQVYEPVNIDVPITAPLSGPLMLRYNEMMILGPCNCVP